MKRTKEISTLFYIYCKLSKTNLDCISELINLKKKFNIPFKITKKAVIMGTASQFRGSVQLNILQILSSEILLLKTGLKRNHCEGLDLPFKQ